MIFPAALPEKVVVFLKDIMLGVGKKLELNISEPFHPSGVWFIDLIDKDEDKWIVLMYSEKRGYGLSLNPIEFNNAPDERVEADRVVSRAVEMLS